jgi:hypothetical protein
MPLRRAGMKLLCFIIMSTAYLKSGKSRNIPDALLRANTNEILIKI